jgi:hypothetical protein
MAVTRGGLDSPELIITAFMPSRTSDLVSLDVQTHNAFGQTNARPSPDWATAKPPLGSSADRFVAISF